MSDSPFTPEQEARIVALIRAELNRPVDQAIVALEKAQSYIDSAIRPIRALRNNESEPLSESITGDD